MATVCSMPGRRTFTATWRPSMVIARWTTAIDARPIGSRSNLANASLQRHADVVLDLLAHLGPGGLRTGVERVAELAGHRVAEHPGRRRHELAELHERGAEVLERAAQRTGPGVRWQVDAADLA